MGTCAAAVGLSRALTHQLPGLAQGTTYKAAMHIDVCFQAEGAEPMRFNKR